MVAVEAAIAQEWKGRVCGSEVGKWFGMGRALEDMSEARDAGVVPR